MSGWTERTVAVATTRRIGVIPRERMRQGERQRGSRVVEAVPRERQR